MNSQLLHSEAAQYRALSDQLKSDYAALDDETLADTLEGLSDLPAMIEEIIRSGLEDEAMIAGLKLRADAMAERLSRLKERHHKKRQLAAWALGAAGSQSSRRSTLRSRSRKARCVLRSAMRARSRCTIWFPSRQSPTGRGSPMPSRRAASWKGRGSSRVSPTSRSRPDECRL